MKNLPLRIGWILFTVLLFGTAGVFEAEAETPGYVKVVSTNPAVRSKVDSSLSEITITFSHPMKHSSYSFQPAPAKPDRFPERTGEPIVSPDGKTWRFPVNLHPGKRYALWLNSPFEQGFVSEDGTPAEWYKLIFKTK